MVVTNLLWWCGSVCLCVHHKSIVWKLLHCCMYQADFGRDASIHFNCVLRKFGYVGLYPKKVISLWSLSLVLYFEKFQSQHIDHLNCCQQLSNDRHLFIALSVQLSEPHNGKQRQQRLLVTAFHCLGLCIYQIRITKLHPFQEWD